MVAAPKPRVDARGVDDPQEIASFLNRDRLYASYALGDLEGPNRSRCHWGMAYDDAGDPIALGLQHQGLVPQPLFLMGSSDGCRAILSEVIKPREAYFTVRPEHQAAVAGLYDLEIASPMLRMVVDRARFRPYPGPVERLGAGDIDALNRLYQLGFAAGFPGSVLQEGVYYGVRVGRRLVSAAGTHAISTAHGIAVVGNVMTHADFRGRGLAKMVTAAVTAELLERVPDVALNVHAQNAPAVAAYTRLGYREYCRLVERLGRRRSAGWDIIRPLREAIRLTWPRD